MNVILAVMNRCAIRACAVVLVLSGCGGSQAATGTPGAISQGVATATHAARGKSWMRPEAKSMNLIYASNEFGDVFIYSYPGGNPEGVLQSGGRSGLCTDNAGDIFVVDDYTQQTYEYPHGSDVLINTLDDSGNYPFGCSSDPTTGNLAVAGGMGKSAANVAVYALATGSPAVYTDSAVRAFYYCTYDSRGNLFALGEDKRHSAVVAELPAGGTSFSPISVDQPLGSGAAAIQWDGSYVAVGLQRRDVGPALIYQVAISGSAGVVVNTVTLHGEGKPQKNTGPSPQFWIQGSTVAGPRGARDLLGLWAYPSGGLPYKHIAVTNTRPWGITVSLAPH